MWTGRRFPTLSTRSNCDMCASEMFRPTSFFSGWASASLPFPADGTRAPSHCSSTPDRGANLHSGGDGLLQRQLRKPPLEKREAAEQNERVEQIAFQRVAQEGKGGRVA